MIRATPLFAEAIKRYKTTVRSIEPDSNAALKRPTPILLLRVAQNDQSKDWASRWQTQFSQLGYYSVDAAIDLPKKEPADILQHCYEDLRQVTSELSFFPPLLISHGPTAWSIAQKYVSNKPVSGLVLVDQLERKIELPSNEFEPRFPILHVNSCETSELPEFLDGWIDQVKSNPNEEFKQVIDWMDHIGM